MRWPRPLAERLALALALSACGRVDPPGRLETDPAPSTLPRPVATVVAPSAPEEPTALPVLDKSRQEPGQGEKIASLAMRTWVYDEPRDGSRKLGYLRAGAVVDRAAESAGTKGCEGGWYRVEPRGYVCVGKGATLDLNDPIVLSMPRAPRRGEPTPYLYVMSGSPPPNLYFRLPTEDDQSRVEGGGVKNHAIEQRHVFDAFPTDPIPEFLAAGKNLPQPYGSTKELSYSVHRGRAKEESAFGLVTTFEWTNRLFGMTTELDLIPLDRTKPARISKVDGVKLEHGGRPAFVLASGTTFYHQVNGRLVAAGPAPPRSGWELTGKSEGGATGLLETTTDGLWLPAPGVVVGDLTKDRVDYATRGRKWISVSIRKQLLIAFEGETPVYATLISSGRGGMSDPDETTATIRGSFFIRSKHVSGTMDGDETSEDSFDLRDVPYIQYFHEGYALHAAYWHDDFGKERSHGCVNLPPAAAAWLFEWTDPPVPKDWHGAMSQQGGTLVWIHG
ncbi:MAG: L,D-transpeptidase [Polyangiaceae bacterium]